MSDRSHALSSPAPDAGAARPTFSACLIVEDRPDMAARAEVILARAFGAVETTKLDRVASALQWIGRLPRDSRCLFLIDLGLPDGSGLDVVSAAAARGLSDAIVVSTIFDDDAHLFAALSAGAQGYVLKDETVEDSVRLLRRVEAGEPPLSPSVARRLVAYFRSRRGEPELIALTSRESETLKLIARGLTTPEAAAVMKLKPQTVASYVKSIYQKLNISSRAEATREAIRRGMI
jgi:DNA-binding NarL/FixJ family response regulator